MQIILSNAYYTHKVTLPNFNKLLSIIIRNKIEYNVRIVTCEQEIQKLKKHDYLKFFILVNLLPQFMKTRKTIKLDLSLLDLFTETAHENNLYELLDTYPALVCCDASIFLEQLEKLASEQVILLVKLLSDRPALLKKLLKNTQDCYALLDDSDNDIEERLATIDKDIFKILDIPQLELQTTPTNLSIKLEIELIKLAFQRLTLWLIQKDIDLLHLKRVAEVILLKMDTFKIDFAERRAFHVCLFLLCFPNAALNYIKLSYLMEPEIKATLLFVQNFKQFLYFHNIQFYTRLILTTVQMYLKNLLEYPNEEVSIRSALIHKDEEAIAHASLRHK